MWCKSTLGYSNTLTIPKIVAFQFQTKRVWDWSEFPVLVVGLITQKNIGAGIFLSTFAYIGIWNRILRKSEKCSLRPIEIS